MAITQVSICNQALDMIGEQPITSIDDAKPRAQALKREYESCLRELLDAAPWNFAKTRALLTASMTPPIFGWDVSYPLPADFIALVQLNGVERWKEIGDFYEIEGGNLLTDEAVGAIQYIFYQTDTSKFSPSFAQAFAAHLASATAAAIRKDGAELGQAIENRYLQVYLPRARMRDANERRRRIYDPAQESRFVMSRRYSTNG